MLYIQMNTIWHFFPSPNPFKELTALIFEGLQSDEVFLVEILIWAEALKQYNEILIFYFFYWQRHKVS